MVYTMNDRMKATCSVFIYAHTPSRTLLLMEGGIHIAGLELASPCPIYKENNGHVTMIYDVYVMYSTVLLLNSIMVAVRVSALASLHQLVIACP